MGFSILNFNKHLARKGRCKFTKLRFYFYIYIFVYK
jgi:hypothetical protein